MKTTPRLVLPLVDYMRIHNVARSVLDAVDASTAHACIFFSMAGAAILREFYNREAIPVAGAMALLVDDSGNGMSFGTLRDDRMQSSRAAFHALVLCGGYAIDFMAPVFPRTCVSARHPFIAPARMFQRPLADNAGSHHDLARAGDFYFAPNGELTADLLRSLADTPANGDLVDICIHWYRRPPKVVAREFAMQSDRHEIIKIRLRTGSVDGAW